MGSSRPCEAGCDITDWDASVCTENGTIFEAMSEFIVSTPNMPLILVIIVLLFCFVFYHFVYFVIALLCLVQHNVHNVV